MLIEREMKRKGDLLSALCECAKVLGHVSAYITFKRNPFQIHLIQSQELSERLENYHLPIVTVRLTTPDLCYILKYFIKTTTCDILVKKCM